ncbi:uncharacterized protein A4U43_UnF5540 [Asparagus officinalis]|uniref:Uncharacterized protein n=1 Tax=Asparagus officinalis TaxID=4686 RepID=A0A1R3L6N2_ASPOF|nr:uncharacterized protein A4U43_UnF5540 [Asparagus officinalis]
MLKKKVTTKDRLRKRLLNTRARDSSSRQVTQGANIGEGDVSSSCSSVVEVGTKSSFERGSKEKLLELGRGRRGAPLIGVDDGPPEVDDGAPRFHFVVLGGA